MLQADAADVATLLEESRLALLDAELDRLTMQGQLHAAREMVDRLTASGQLSFHWWHKRALLSVALCGVREAKSDLACADTGLDEWWAAHR